jgi:hypothetical protein
MPSSRRDQFARIEGAFTSDVLDELLDQYCKGRAEPTQQVLSALAMVYNKSEREILKRFHELQSDLGEFAL